MTISDKIQLKPQTHKHVQVQQGVHVGHGVEHNNPQRRQSSNAMKSRILFAFRRRLSSRRYGRHTAREAPTQLTQQLISLTVCLYYLTT